MERQLEKVQASLGQITGMNVFVADEKDIGGIEKALCEILGTGARRYQVVGFPNGAIKLELMVMARARNAGGVL